MSEELSRQSIIDEEHLKLLSLGYMISAGVSAFFSLFGLFYVFMGVALSAALSNVPYTVPKAAEPPPALFGWVFGGIGLAIFLLMIGFGALKLRTAFCIKRRKSRTFCMVIAGISCLGIPYGTVLGVLSFIVLTRDSVARQFDTPPRDSSPVSAS